MLALRLQAPKETPGGVLGKLEGSIRFGDSSILGNKHHFGKISTALPLTPQVPFITGVMLLDKALDVKNFLFTRATP